MSELRATTISDLAGTGPVTLTGQSAAKAWASNAANGTAVNYSFNTSSITDNGAGDYTFNLANAMSSSSFIAVGSDNGLNVGANPNTASSWRVRTYNTSDTLRDNSTYSTVHGDLA